MTQKKAASSRTREAAQVPDTRKRVRQRTNYSSKKDNSAIPGLTPAHLAELRASAISDDIIRERGYRTVTDDSELRTLGFKGQQLRAPGLLLPLHSTDSGEVVLYQFKPDNPRVKEHKDKRDKDGQHPNEVIKYETIAKAGIRLDCPPRCRAMLGDPARPIWFTEGIKKADALAKLGVCAVALLGVYNFKGKNEFGGVTFLADFDYITLKGREARIVFDSDVMTKRQVKQALDRFTEHLKRKGAHVQAVYLPKDKDRKKTGVDDYLADGNTLEDLEELIEGPRLAQRPASPNVKLLDAAPPVIRRPLCVINGISYVATWLHVEMIITQDIKRNGEIVILNPPRKETPKKLFIIRKDGRVFGDVDAGDVTPLAEIGIDTHLPEELTATQTWSSAGVKAYCSGVRPEPAHVFQRLVDIINRFMDFDSSLAEQNTVAEMVACYILATWFLDAFTIIGYIWPNGDKGSGKTKLLAIAAQLAYLGIHLQGAGASFAALRDLADYGATICFDDCEDFANAKGRDDEKRQFLLAGNRRGSDIPLKEPQANGTWKTRHVNAFCAKLFSATQLPDSVLESRTIIIPLVKSPDEGKSNADVLDFDLWPHPRQALLDDLWAVALAHLSAMPAYAAPYNTWGKLVGRDLEPWRAILAVSAWLEAHHVTGLRQRMESLSLSYQTERPELTAPDPLVIALKAVRKLVNDSSTESPWTFATATITDIAKALIIEDEIDYDPEYLTAKRVGRILRKLRFNKDRTSSKRQWLITRAVLDKRLKSYGLLVKLKNE